MIGQTVGPYRVLEKLGEGGMGEVYRARDTTLKRDVALKVLPEAFSLDPDRRARFEREAQLLASLNHPNIAQIHGWEDTGTVRAIVLELVEGPTLADRIAHGRVPLPEALRLALPIAEALEAAHERGVVHRDLKPANIKVRADGMVKVLDFGVAKALSPGTAGAANPALSQSPTLSTPALTQVSAVLGTAAYMSPEQARGQPVDQRTDVWAFGCLLYELLAGRPAFAGGTTTETLAAVLEREPDWTLVPATLPPGIARLLRRCLQKDPRRRLHHIADARLEIEDAASEPAGASAPVPARISRRERLLGLTTGVLAVALAIALVAAMVALYARGPVSAPLYDLEITTPWAPDPMSLALSPDGRTLAFVAEHNGQLVLWIRPLDDAAAAQPLAGTENARRPFWSPDSRSIAFFTAGGQVRRVDARGGPSRRIASITGGLGGSWGPDGTILVSTPIASTLLRVSADGGPIETVTTSAPDSTSHRHPHFLPGGRRFLFFVTGSEGVRGVYLGSLDSADVTPLVASDTKGVYVAPGWLLFARQGALLAQRFDPDAGRVWGDPVRVADSVAMEALTGDGAFSASAGGTIAYRADTTTMTRLSWFDRSGTPLGTIGAAEQTGLRNPTLSPDGRQVAVERTLDGEPSLWRLEGTRQMQIRRAPAGSIARLPVWSPDSDRIAFSRGAGAELSAGLALMPASGGSEVVLLESRESIGVCDWSPDGRFLMYYVSSLTTGPDLHVLPLEGTGEPFVFLATEAAELWGQFSPPDGRWVAYQSNETGRFEIYARRFPSGPQVQVTSDGGVYPRWSADGTELYYIAPDAKMMAVPIADAETTLTIGQPEALFQTRRVGGGSNVVAQSHQYDVAPDGRFLINVEAESSARSVRVLLNWTPD